MQVIRGDDYQSWIYANSRDLIVVDPWFTKKQVFPKINWLLNRESTQEAYLIKNKLIEKNIINDKVFTKNLKTSSFDTIYSSEKSIFNNIDKIAALSDIHGQYDLVIKLFKNKSIIINIMRNINIHAFLQEHENELLSLYDYLKSYNPRLLEKLTYIDFCKTVYYNFY